MGDTKKIRKKYSRPRKLWSVAKLDEERKLMKAFGLQNKKELWRAQALVRNKRQNARKMLAQSSEERKKLQGELIESLARYGILGKNAMLDNVLSLNAESVMERRLQTIVWRAGLAGTIQQARQFITHGHIAVNGKKITSPGYMVPLSEEKKIAFYKKPLHFQAKKGNKEKAPEEAEKVPEKGIVKEIVGESVEIAEPELIQEIAEERQLEKALEEEKIIGKE